MALRSVMAGIPDHLHIKLKHCLVTKSTKLTHEKYETSFVWNPNTNCLWFNSMMMQGSQFPFV